MRRSGTRCKGGASSQAHFTHAAVGQLTDATARNLDDYTAGRTNENTLVLSRPGTDGSPRPVA
ncbi:hypothetical protein ACFRMQ_16115 [Kitasatospora sp. NPDC056783]|uniref:hypothetical protein n=1 Tax=Kitasatospora sp. NPDC056783 TaxID=3345943 RepID=UPI003682C40E